MTENYQIVQLLFKCKWRCRPRGE